MSTFLTVVLTAPVVLVIVLVLAVRIVTMPIQSQGIITRDNVSVDVSAVAYYRVIDAVKSVVAIENVRVAIDHRAHAAAAATTPPVPSRPAGASIHIPTTNGTPATPATG